jgi:hypothetical protein
MAHSCSLVDHGIFYKRDIESSLVICINDGHFTSISWNSDIRFHVNCVAMKFPELFYFMA